MIVITIGTILIALVLYIAKIYDPKANVSEDIDNPYNEKTINAPSILMEAGAIKQEFTLESIINKVSDEFLYTKIGVTIKNLQNYKVSTTKQIFELLDENGNTISTCYGKGILNNLDVDDIIPEYLETNSTNRGYLYCGLLERTANQLKIRNIINGVEDTEGNVTFNYKDYYIDIK